MLYGATCCLPCPEDGGNSSAEMLVPIYQTTHCHHILEDSNLQFMLCYEELHGTFHEVKQEIPSTDRQVQKAKKCQDKGNGAQQT
jgi:hypothetical protein